MFDQETTVIVNTAISTDGAKIVYHTIGTGPGLLIIHGASSHGLSHLDLARLLADSFTVHLVSRRHRGLSDNYPSSILELEALASHSVLDTENPSGNSASPKRRTYNEDFSNAVLKTDLDDIALVLEATGSEFVLGVSVGAILALEISLSSKSVPSFYRVRKLVIFEPPLQFLDLDTGLEIQGTKKYEEEMAKDDVAGAMITAMRLVQLLPTWMPEFLMRVGCKLMIRYDSNSAPSEGNTSLTALAPILRYDFAVVERVLGYSHRYEAVGKEKQFLLLGGGNSPTYAKAVTDTLENVIPGATRVVIPGVGHEVLCNKEQRGAPGKVIDHIKGFLA